MIRFACSSCKSVMEAPDNKAGTTVACPRCKQALRVPAAVAAKPVAPVAVKPAGKAPVVPVVTVPAVPVVPAAPRGTAPLMENASPLVLLLRQLNPKIAIGAAAGLVVLLAVFGIVRMFSSPAKKPAKTFDDVGEVERIPLKPPKEVAAQRTMTDLVEDLQSPDFETRMKAALAIDKEDKVDKRALKPLAALLQDRTDSASSLALRKIAARSLGKIGPEAEPAVEQLRIALGDPNVEVRFLSLEALGKIGRAGVGPIIDTLGDAKLQLKACEVLSRMGSDARNGVPTMVEVMRSIDADHRVQVASYIVRLDSANQAVLPVLIAGLKDSNDTTRRTAAISLGVMGPNAKSAENALYDCATMDINEEVKKEAEEAYRKIGGGK